TGGCFEPMHDHQPYLSFVVDANEVAFVDAHDELGARVLPAPAWRMLGLVGVEAAHSLALPGATRRLEYLHAEVLARAICLVDAPIALVLDRNKILSLLRLQEPHAPEPVFDVRVVGLLMKLS